MMTLFTCCILVYSFAFYAISDEFKKRKYFYYRNTWSYISFWIAFGVILLFWAYFFLGKYDVVYMPHKDFADEYYVLFLGIFVSYLVSFLFHLGVNVRDNDRKDSLGVYSLNAIAECYYSASKLEMLASKCPCLTSEGILNLTQIDCKKVCQFNESNRCYALIEFDSYLQAIQRSLDKYSNVASINKPEILYIFLECLQTIQFLSQRLKSGFYSIGWYRKISHSHELLLLNGAAAEDNPFYDAKQLSIQYANIDRYWQQMIPDGQRVPLYQK